LTTPIVFCYGSYSDAKCESGQQKRMNSERAMESIGNGRLRVGEHVPPSPPGEGEAKDAPRGYWDRPQRSAACGYSGEPKLINAVEWKNIRLCSLMFAYVRLCSLNRKKNVEGAAHGHRGMQNARNDDRAKPVRSDRQSGQIRPNPTKSDQIRPNAAKSNQVKGFRRGTEAVGGTPTVAGGTPALPNAWGPSRSRPVSVDNDEPSSSSVIAPIKRTRGSRGDRVNRGELR